MKLDKKLMGEFNAKIWAEEFVEAAKNNPIGPTDVDTMNAWFGSAIMTGFDEGRKHLNGDG